MSDFLHSNLPSEPPKTGDFRTDKIPSVNKMMESSNQDPALTALLNVYNRPDIKSQIYTNPVIKTNLSDSNASYAYYSNELGFSSVNPELEQKYEARQGIWDSVKNRLVKTGMNGITGLYSGFASTFDFISGKGTQGIASNNGIDKLNEFTEELNTKLPNFKSTYDINNPYFNTHLLGETFQSLGFTAGAIGSSLIIDALIAPVTSGLGAAVLLPKQLANLTSKWGKLSSALVEGGKNYKTLLSSLDEAGELTTGVAKALKNYNRYSKITDAARFGVNVGISSLGESAIEASQTAREIRKNLMDQYVDEYGNYNGGEELLQKIENTAKEGGANTILPNFMFLALSNSLGLSSILRPSRAAAKATQEALGSRIGLSVNNINTISTTVTPYSKGFQGLLERMKSPTAMIKDNLRESFEEGYQFVISDANTNYYQRKFNAKANNDTTSMQEEYYNSIGKLFTTEEGIQSMIMGFGGGVIQNVIKRVVNRAIGIKEGAELAAQIQKNLNTYTTTSIFSSPRQEAVTADTILKEMETAAANGDIMGYKNLQLEALFNWVHSGVKNNKFEARLEQLELLKGLDEESFQTMWGVDFSENSKKTVDAYIDAVANKAKNIKNHIEQVDNAFGKNSFNKNDNPLKYAAFENYKQELAISLSQMEDYKRRVNDIKNNISSKLPAINLDEVVELSSIEGISNTIDRFNTRIEELKNSEELAKGNKDLVNTFKEEREFLERRVKEMAWAKEDNKNYTQDFLGTINSIHNYYANGKTVRGNFSINELDSYNILANSKDVDLLLKESERISNYYRELAGKDGYIEFEKKYTKDVTDYLDNLIITSDGKVRVKEIEEPKDIADKLAENERELQANLKSVGVSTTEELREEIKNGNVAVREGMLRKRDPNDPKATEREIAEAEALADVWENFPQMEEMTFGTIAPRGTAKVIPGEGSIREKAAQIEDEEDTSKPKEESTSSQETAPDDTTEEILVPTDKIWKNAVFKFYNFFNKINYWKNKKEDFLGELLKVLSNNSKEDIINNLTFKLEPAPASSKKATKVPLFVKQKDGSYKKQFTDLKFGAYTHNVEIWFKNKKVGILQEPTRIGFESANGDFVPLGNVTSAREYAELTLNDESTYEEFRKQYDAYNSLYQSIVSKEGKKKVFSNKEVKELFNIAINYGRIASTKNEEFATKVSDLKLWEGSGIVYLNKEGELIIMNEDELNPLQLKELVAFLGSEAVNKNLKKSGRDYFVISRLPDGRFTDKLSIIYARSNDIKIEAEQAGKMFKGKDSLSNLLINIKSKEHGTSKLSFERQDNGSVKMILTNNRRSVRQEFILPSSEIEASENIEDIVDLINLSLTKINNPLLRKIDMKVRSGDFMSLGVTEKTSTKELKENLSAAVSTPDIYAGFSLNFYPKGMSMEGSKPTTTPTTPAEPASVKPTTTPVEQAQPEVVRLDIVPESEYMEFIDKGTVSEERMDSIADKVIANTPLSPYETAIFTGKTSEINEIIRKKAEANEPLEDRIVNQNLNSIILQLESKGFLTKNCD